LQNSSFPVYQIAEEAGIRNANYFSKLIKQQTGKSPKKIQKDLR
jgi:YesN/AraC family two-component response regulator